MGAETSSIWEAFELSLAVILFVVIGGISLAVLTGNQVDCIIENKYSSYVANLASEDMQVKLGTSNDIIYDEQILKTCPDAKIAIESNIYSNQIRITNSQQDNAIIISS